MLCSCEIPIGLPSKDINGLTFQLLLGILFIECVNQVLHVFSGQAHIVCCLATIPPQPALLLQIIHHIIMPIQAIWCGGDDHGPLFGLWVSQPSTEHLEGLISPHLPTLINPDPSHCGASQVLRLLHGSEEDGCITKDDDFIISLFVIIGEALLMQHIQKHGLGGIFQHPVCGSCHNMGQAPIHPCQIPHLLCPCPCLARANACNEGQDEDPDELILCPCPGGQIAWQIKYKIPLIPVGPEAFGEWPAILFVRDRDALQI